MPLPPRRPTPASPPPRRPPPPRASAGFHSREPRSAPVSARHSGLSLFLLSPPYERRRACRDPGVLSSDELPFGTLVGLEVPGTSPNWTEVEQAVETLRRRSPRVPVVVSIDPEVEDLLHVAARMADIPSRAVLFRNEPVAATLRRQLTRPGRLPEDLVDWLAIRGVRISPTVAYLIGSIVSRAGRHRQVATLLHEVGVPESSARFRCRKKRLPSPGRWLHLSRALRAAMRMQAEPHRPLLPLAQELGYADHSALSNQMQRVFSLRPGPIRRVLGWEWLVDRWLRMAESRHGSTPR